MRFTEDPLSAMLQYMSEPKLRAKVRRACSRSSSSRLGAGRLLRAAGTHQRADMPQQVGVEREVRLVAPSLHVAREGQRPALHTEHDLRDVPVPVRPDAGRAPTGGRPTSPTSRSAGCGRLAVDAAPYPDSPTPRQRGRTDELVDGKPSGPRPVLMPCSGECGWSSPTATSSSRRSRIGAARLSVMRVRPHAASVAQPTHV